jgi:hypothetical protein
MNTNEKLIPSHYRVNHQTLAKQLLSCGDGRYEVAWDTDAKVTHVGSLIFFAQFLSTCGLLDRMCVDSPLRYKSNNAPKERDIFGTIVLSILTGQTRYAHISSLRNDTVAADIFGMIKVVSEDSVRRALSRGTPEEWDRWLLRQEYPVYEPLLTEEYIIDIDGTVKPLYGNQEGAEIGFNPQKPGRPSHTYHTYGIGALRIILGVDVLPGNQTAGKYSLPGLWKIIDRLPAACKPRLIRGDISYGNENAMAEAEKRGQKYLFKLRQTPLIQRQIELLNRTNKTWTDAGDGWNGTEVSVRLTGWTKSRRCIFLRRKIKEQLVSESARNEFSFIELVDGVALYEYAILVTNDALPIYATAQLYRDRADSENVFDEIKNQWGWSGFVTQDLHRCRVMARLIAVVYNWWNIFTRLAKPEQHLEAITSRPQLLQSIGRLVKTGRRTILRLTPTHALSESIQQTLSSIASFLSLINRTAEQLSVERRWALILSAAFVKWLRGRVLQPVSDSGQLLLVMSD